jgi:hypothetical protein
MIFKFNYGCPSQIIDSQYYFIDQGNPKNFPSDRGMNACLSERINLNGRERKVLTNGG